MSLRRLMSHRTISESLGNDDGCMAKVNRNGGPVCLGALGCADGIGSGHRNWGKLGGGKAKADLLQLWNNKQNERVSEQSPNSGF